MASSVTVSKISATIATLIESGKTTLDGAVDTPRLDAELLLAFALDATRSTLAAWPERPVDAARRAVYENLVQRRARGEPVAYLVGKREFWSLELEVSPDTLIPRPATEHLVERALQLLSAETQGPVLDLGTGSGAIALALAAERPGLALLAVDRNPAALQVAIRNARRLQLKIDFRESDWFAALAHQRFALIVANPPYVPADDPHLARGDVRFEPRMALDGGPDGLTALRTIIATASGHLLPDGVLLLEHGLDQGPAVLKLLRRHGFDRCRDHPDLSGRPRVAEGHWPGASLGPDHPHEESS